MTAARGEEGLGQLSKVALNVIDNIGSYGRITVVLGAVQHWRIVWPEGKLVKHN